MQEYQFHEYAEVFPLIQGELFDKLTADIKSKGLDQTIVLFEDRILDGRNRYRACLAAGVEPRFEEVKAGQAHDRRGGKEAEG